MLSADKKSGPSTICTKAALSVIFSLLTFAGLQLTASTVVDGRFLYDPASVPFFAEILKLVISVFMAASTVRSACFEMVSRETVWLYAPPAFLFWISNNARMLSYQYLEPPVLHLLSNLRITFTAILMWLCLKRQFTRVQWLAIFLLPVSMIVSNYKAPLLQAARFTPGTAAVSIALNPRDRDALLSHILPILYFFLQARGYVLAVISAAASSGSIVYTEWSLKSTTSSIHVQNAQLYSWGVIVNLVYFYFRGSSGHPLFKLSHGRFGVTATRCKVVNDVSQSICQCNTQ